MNFCKLNYQHRINPFDVEKMFVFFGYNYPYGLHYSDISNTNNHLFEILPPEFRKFFRLSFLEINVPFVPPHIDNEIITSINFYIKANNYTTSYYSLKTDNPETKQITNHTNGCLFKYEDLEKTESFIANDNETYIIDVSKIHDVRKNSLETTNIRTALVMASSKISFDQTLELLKKQNLVDYN
jgi:hypothetical protein